MVVYTLKERSDEHLESFVVSGSRRGVQPKPCLLGGGGGGLVSVFFVQNLYSTGYFRGKTVSNMSLEYDKMWFTTEISVNFHIDTRFSISNVRR